MAKPVSMTLKVNLIGTAALLTIVGYLAYDLTHSEQDKPCSQAYPPSVALNLVEGNGEMLTAVALQARSRSQDWGILNKLTVEQVADAPVSNVFKVALPKGDVSSSLNKKGGAAFPWQPSRLAGATSVCFAYSVWLPEDFDFTEGGILPGVASPQVEDPDADEDDDNALIRKFRAHLGWSEAGTVQLLAFDPSVLRGNDQLVLSTKKTLTPGRWHHLEQEIVLNDDGKKNGEAKLWVDDELVLDATNLVLSDAEATQIGSAFYHVSRGTPFGNGIKLDHADSVIRISPMELSWK